jgi:hypothetical protein
MSILRRLYNILWDGTVRLVSNNLIVVFAAHTLRIVYWLTLFAVSILEGYVYSI